MKKYRPHFIVLSLYTLLTLALTWPWTAQFASAFPGSATWAFDESTFIWNIWRFKHNLLNLQQSPLHTTDIFWPLGISLVLYTYNFLNALLGMPILLSMGLPMASNITILLAYVLSGYGTYLLLRYLLPGKQSFIQQLAAFAGGAIYAFLASRAIFSALGHYDIVSTGFIPFFTLYFIKTLREKGWQNPIMAGIFAALCLLAEMIFGVFLLFLGLGLIIFHSFSRQNNTPLATRNNLPASLNRFLNLLPKMIVLALTAAIIWSPVMLPILKAFRQGSFALEGWGESLKLSADLVGWFTPTDLHPLWGSDWVTRLREVQAGTAPFSDVNTVFLGYGILALALLGGIIYRKQLAAWIVAAIVFAIFTLGPLLQIKGRFLFPLDNLLREQGLAQDITFPMPFALLHYIPVINANRVPARFSVVLGLSLAVLAGFGVYWILQKLNWGKPALIALTGGLVFIALFDQLALPLPLTQAKVPEVYEQIGAESGDFSLLQLPLGWRNSFGVYGAERTQIQYYQHIHNKPMLGGNISRAPDFKFDYYKNIPLFQAIAQTELPTTDPAVAPETLDKARQQAGDLMTLYNVGYVVMHDPIPNRKPYEDTYIETQALVKDLLPLEAEPTYVSDGVAAYQVIQPPVPDVLRLEFGDWTGDPYRGEGWAGNEFYQGAGVNWAVEPQALIFFPYQGQGDRSLKMHLSPFTYDNAPQQNLSLSLNGQPIGEFPLSQSWQVLETTLPAEALQPGLNRLSLQFSQQAVPRQVLPADTVIGATGVNVPTDIELNSHADFSFVTVGFGDEAVDASAHRRGFNVALIDPASGEVLEVKGFDTAANEFEDQALQSFIEQIPAGIIVTVSSQGADAGQFLSRGFATLGGSEEVPPAPYSLIGVKGAAPNSALQASGEAYLRLGANPDTRSLAVAVDWVEIGRLGD